MIPCGIYSGRQKADALTFRLNDDPGRPENVPDQLNHLVKVYRLK